MVGPANEHSPGAQGGSDSVDPTRQDADPVNTLTGAFVESAVDLVLPGRGPVLVFGRSYQSNDEHRGDLGPGWQHTYEARVVASTDAVVLVGEDGQRTVYARTEDGELEPRPGTRTRLRELEDGWEARRLNGERLRFDAQGRLRRISDRFGQSITVDWNGNRIDRVTNVSGRFLAFQYEEANLASVTASDGRTVSFAYQDGRLVEATDATGGVFRYGYNVDGFLDEVIDANGDTMVVSEYDPQGRVVEQVEGGTRRWALRYAVNGAEQTTVVTDPAGDTRTYVYRNRALVAVEDGLGNRTEFSYDDDLNLVAATDARGNRTTYRYDDMGRTIGMTPPAPFDVETRLRYDSDGNLIEVSNPSTGRAEFRYDVEGRLVAIVDLEGNTTRLEYADAPGLPTAVVLPDGGRWLYEYDASGNVVRSVSPGGIATAYGYDDRGNLVETREERAGGGATTWTMSYDDAGRLISATDPLGATVEQEYDAIGRLRAVVQPDGSRIRYEYNAAASELVRLVAGDGAETVFEWQGGRVVSRLAPTGARTGYSYDGAGRLVEVQGPNGGTWQYAYDENGNVVEVVEPTGKRTELAYNSLDALERAVEPNGTEVGFEFDQLGRVIARRDAFGEHAFTYDRLGRLAQIATDGRITHRYDFDEMGQLTSRVVDGLDEVSFAYDADGLPIEVSTADLRIEQEFDDRGRLVERRHANGAVTRVTWDDASRPIRMLTRDPDGRTVDAHVYRYDPNGQPVRHQTLTVDVRHRYDEQGRLIESVTTARGTGEVIEEHAYRYDQAGRRTAADTPAGTITYRYNQGEQLVEAQGPDGAITYEYDASGNRVRAGDLRFDFGPLGRVDAVETSDGVRVDYRYDGAGVRREATSSDGSAVSFVWDLGVGNYPLLGVDDGETTEAYLRGPGGDLLAALTTSTSDGGAIHTDALGSVTALTDPVGDLAATFTYDPYGARQQGSGSLAIGFTGEFHDPVSELVHLRLRDYDPATGQFTALDPAPQSALSPYITPYHYGFNAPTVYTDPSGACPWCVVGAVVGGVVGGAVEAGRQMIVEGKGVGDLDWGRVGSEALGGAIVGAVGPVAGPLGGTIARGLGSTATSALARGSSYAITGAAGAAGTQAASLSRGDGFAGAGATVLGMAGAMGGRAAVGAAGRFGLITQPHGIHTMAQMRHFGPNNMSRVFTSSGRNYRALRESEAASFGWGVVSGGVRVFVESQMPGSRSCAKC